MYCGCRASINQRSKTTLKHKQKKDMQTSTSNLINYIVRNTKLPASKVKASEWVTIILGLISQLKHYFPEFELFSPLNDTLWGFSDGIGGRWEIKTCENVSECLRRTKLPDGITLETKAIVLHRFGVQPTEHIRKVILLTEQGVLLKWVYDRTNPNRSMSMSFLKASEMEKHFAKDYMDAYSIFHRLCWLPQVFVGKIQQQLNSAKELARCYEAKHDLIGMFGLYS